MKKHAVTLQVSVLSSKSWHAEVTFTLSPAVSVRVTWYVCISLTFRIPPTTSVHANIEAALMSQLVLTQSSDSDFCVDPSTIAQMQTAEHRHAINAAERNSCRIALRKSRGLPSCSRIIILLALAPDPSFGGDQLLLGPWYQKCAKC